MITVMTDRAVARE